MGILRLHSFRFLEYIALDVSVTVVTVKMYNDNYHYLTITFSYGHCIDSSSIKICYVFTLEQEVSETIQTYRIVRVLVNRRLS